MSYCRGCGAYIPSGFDTCPACGMGTDESAAARQREQARSAGSAAGQGAQAQAAPSSAARGSAETAADTIQEAARQAAEAAKLAAEEIRRSVEPGSGRARGARRQTRSGADRYYSADEAGAAGGDAAGREDAGPARYAAEYEDDVAANRGLGKLCYLGPLLLVPLLTKPHSQFLRYHCNQGLVLALFCILVSIGGHLPVIGWAISVFGWISAISWLFKGMSNVEKGLRRPLPLIGDITILK